MKPEAGSPLVSIVLPTYNRAHLIGETIQSVISQTYSLWELIIVDDGSSDNTREVVGGIGDIRIQYLYINHTGLLGAVKNHALKISSGQFIAFIDSDDLWKNHKLGFQLDLFNRYPEAGFIMGNAEFFGLTHQSPPDCEELFVGSLFLPILMSNRFVCYTPTLIIKKEVLDTVGLMNEHLPGVDMEFLLKVSHEYTGIFTNERLVRIRKHDQNTSDLYPIERYRSIIKTVSSFYEKGILKREQYFDRLRLYYYKMGLRCFEENKAKTAILIFWRYIKISPLHWKGWVRFAQAVFLTAKSWV